MKEKAGQLPRFFIINTFVERYKEIIMEKIEIKKATEEDVEVLINIGKQTFVETFAENNAKENIEKYLRDNFTTDKVKSELENTESVFYIVWDGHFPIGYLKVNFGNAQTESQDNTFLEIERIYVKAEYHGKKVGQLLYEKALEVAQSLNKSFIWLGVWEKNPKAIRFYEKNGFIVFDKHVFKMGDEEQTDIMMKKAL